jgi:hypothetical protein
VDDKGGELTGADFTHSPCLLTRPHRVLVLLSRPVTMDSLAGEQLPLTSFFGRAASSSTAAARKPLKKKKDLAPPARKLGKQSKLTAVPTPPPTASGSSSKAAEKELPKTAVCLNHVRPSDD